MAAEPTVKEKEKEYDIEAHYRELEQKLLASGSSYDLGRIRMAFDAAELAHLGQKRKDGTPYISHCIAAAVIAVEMGLARVWTEDDAILASPVEGCSKVDLNRSQLLRRLRNASRNVADRIREA